MPFDPYNIICEILGQPAQQMQNPVNEDYLCPYRNCICTKRSHRIDGPFPVCSVFRKLRTDTESVPMAVCPRRLYAANIYNDVINNCWPGEPPTNPIVVHEVKMGDVGKVDMVIADLSDDGQSIRNFVSIELQTVDITGSYEPAYSAIVLNSDLEAKPTYSFTDSNLNHTGIYLYSKGKIMIHLTFDYKTDEKCTTPGQYLKYHRTFQGFTTRELAEKVGIVPATLVLYENDRHPIKHSTAVALANALGIDRNRLLDKYTAFVDYPYSTLLKKVRQELSLTQMQMAEVIGIGQTSYSGWEREIRVPRRKEYEKILAALKKLKVNADTYLCNPAST